MMNRVTSFVAMVVVFFFAVGAEAEMTHQWHLDGNTATDSVGALDGIPVDTTATANLLGQAGKAMDFNGTTSRVNFTGALNLGDSGTIALLTRPDAFDASLTEYAFAARTTGQNDRLYIATRRIGDVDYLRFAFGDNSQYDHIDVDGREGTWLYTGMTWAHDSESGNYAVSPFCTDVSGNVVMSATTSIGGNAPFGAAMVFGTGPSGSGNFYGAIDQVTFHDTALSLSELQASYDSIVIPEPSASILLLMAMISLLAFRFRK